MSRIAKSPILEPHGPQEPKRQPKREQKITTWASFWETKSNQNPLKIDHIFGHVSWSTFLSILAPFWEFASISVTFFEHVSKHAIFLIFEGCLIRFAYFWRPGALQIRSKIHRKSSSNLGCVFCHIFINFGLHFDLQNGAVWPPKASQKRVQNLTSKKTRRTPFGLNPARTSRSPPYRL